MRIQVLNPVTRKDQILEVSEEEVADIETGMTKEEREEQWENELKTEAWVDSLKDNDLSDI